MNAFYFGQDKTVHIFGIDNDIFAFNKATNGQTGVITRK